LWFSVQDSGRTRSITVANALCERCIEVERLVLLGDTTGDGFLEMTTAATRDSLGRYWLGQRGQIKVYNPSGKFVAAVGRPGQGPMEFHLPTPTFTDSAGLVHVFDRGNSRESVINSKFALHSDRRIPASDVFSVAPNVGAGTYVMNMWIATEAQAGYNLHVVRGDSILKSFGEPDESGTMNVFTSQRLLATDGDGRVLSAKRFDLDVVAWSPEGRRIAGFRGSPLNASPVKWAAFNRTDNPLPSEVVAIRIEDGRYLWLVTKRPRDGWRSLVTDKLYPNGMVGMAPKPGVAIDSMFVSRIEVVDLSSATILARRETSEKFIGFIGSGLLLENATDAEGHPRAAVWRLRLRLP